MCIKKMTHPKVGNWIVKYDDLYQMPQFVQGKLVGNVPSLNLGSQVVIKSIESIDLRDKIVTTYTGGKYKLISPGKRMFLIGEDEMLELELEEIGEDKN